MRQLEQGLSERKFHQRPELRPEFEAAEFFEPRLQPSPQPFATFRCDEPGLPELECKFHHQLQGALQFGRVDQPRVARQFG